MHDEAMNMMQLIFENLHSNIRSLVARNSFKDPVIHDAIVDIKLTPKRHPLQVLQGCLLTINATRGHDMSTLQYRRKTVICHF